LPGAFPWKTSSQDFAQTSSNTDLAVNLNAVGEDNLVFSRIGANPHDFAAHVYRFDVRPLGVAELQVV
jgi:hypothetical protein